MGKHSDQNRNISLEERVKNIESMLGMSKDGATKNVHMLLDTIMVQGEQIQQMNQQIRIMGEIIAQRDAFIRETGNWDKMNAWITQKQEEAKKEMEAEKARRAAAPLTEHKLPGNTQPPTQPTAQPPTEPSQIKEADGMIKAEDKKPKQVVTEDKSQDAQKVVEDSKKEVVNDG